MSNTKEQSLLSEKLFGTHHSNKRQLRAAAGASDAVAVAEAARECAAHAAPLVVICAEAADVYRLADEIGWLAPELSVRVFPDWETLPYDQISPHEDLVSERLETLFRLASRVPGRRAPGGAGIDVLLVSATTASLRISPPSFVSATTFFFSRGDILSTTDFKHRLVLAGYAAVSQVMAPGEFCVRGEIIDLFPMGSETPYRIGLFDDEIETIKAFDEATQRTTEEADAIRILPGREFPMDEAGALLFRKNWLRAFPKAPASSPAVRDIASHIAPAGIEYFLPLFFEETATLFDYAGEDAKFLLTGDVNGALSRFMTETRGRWEFLSRDTAQPALPPDELYLSPEAFFKALAPFERWTLDTVPDSPFPALAVDRRAKDPLALFKSYLADCRKKGVRVLAAASSAGREETVRELMREYGLAPAAAPTWEAFRSGTDAFALTHAPLARGFLLEAEGIALVTETELYKADPRRTVRRRERRSNVDAMIRDLSELRPGDPVVHVEHGIGRYQGLVAIQTQEGASECLQIDYAGDAKLYIPVSQLHLISRYSGADRENAPLHRLGRGDWEKAKKKASQQVCDTAAELLHLYALRENRPGLAFTCAQTDYEAFAEGFAFQETPDQQAAIDAVLADMKGGRPMDRLVCGDVGFGKTEVALRAAFVAVMSGKQVAVLCPTTLLAEQHAQTFRDRFANWPVTIAELSRFRSGKETAAALKALEAGTADIVIGTHKLLSENVKFASLGLVVIDEEHRFGVRQKEKLKSLRAEVDVLTLTATPIPRTMSMSLEGVRDFSVIATAPEKRLAVKTFVRPESSALIREAVLRELKRGGQVYFLHNEVETIRSRYERLLELVPEARIAIAHGQMAERELERVMREFNQKKFNVLLCTTIIETGIDIPSANTIIIHRADRFGLAQLHQLRGRVGRSHHQAYAYLLTPPEASITKNAEKRLDALQNLEELGSGFYLAMHDLEIRGAGEVLGEHQSGEIANVGFDLYNQMLRSAVKALRRGENPDIEHPFSTVAEINLHAPALLPSDYVPDVSQRLSFYKAFAGAEDKASLAGVVEDLADRFGELPEPARLLVETHRLRLQSEALGIVKIDAAREAIILTVAEKPRFEPLALIDLMQKRGDMRMLGPVKIKVSASVPEASQRIALTREILAALEPKKAPQPEKSPAKFGRKERK